jgi:hypothetical protein
MIGLIRNTTRLTASTRARARECLKINFTLEGINGGETRAGKLDGLARLPKHGASLSRTLFIS